MQGTMDQVHIAFHNYKVFLSCDEGDGDYYGSYISPVRFVEDDGGILIY